MANPLASYLSLFLTVSAILLAVPALIFFIEIFAAILVPIRNSKTRTIERQECVAVLVPAHNEGEALLPTLLDIKKQLFSADRLVVVADNCADNTFSVATNAGAEAVERHDPAKIGKGYALDFGLRYLSLNPPSVLIVIDADCRIAEGTIDRLATTCAATGRPVQALDLMTAPIESPINHRVAEFAWRVKNWVRPLGLNALNLPCQLMGTGMAFPWKAIESINVASGSIVEDLKLGLDLAQIGKAPLFCPAAQVTSHFPTSIEGTKIQRRRWEEGHIGVIMTTVPRLIGRAIAYRNLDLFTLCIDLAIPPISLLLVLLVGLSFIAGVAFSFGLSPLPIAICAASLAGLMLAIFISWLKYGRDILPVREFPALVAYVYGKLSIYRRSLLGDAAPKWIRAERKKAQASDDAG